jgi:hypothetical protein
LAFLLDPNQNHGLEDRFLGNLLREALTGAQAMQDPACEVRRIVLPRTLVNRFYSRPLPELLLSSAGQNPHALCTPPSSSRY